jgi:hypothetical protein
MGTVLPLIKPMGLRRPGQFSDPDTQLAKTTLPAAVAWRARTATAAILSIAPVRAAAMATACAPVVISGHRSQ